MKWFIFVFSCVLFVACNEPDVEEPKHEEKNPPTEWEEVIHEY